MEKLNELKNLKCDNRSQQEEIHRLKNDNKDTVITEEKKRESLERENNLLNS